MYEMIMFCNKFMTCMSMSIGMAMGTIPYGDTYNIPIPIYSLSSHPHPRLHDWG